ncbi:MAG: cytochrome c nitrite reductase small subunit [Armatimonadetes bacterium]|nr:cytochrome c nitrite reductase small subunit [Armatimonadota bacterium]
MTAVAAWTACGTFIGLGAYVATASNALSYASDDPKACINCHVMNSMYASWQRGSHAKVANCNDCHVPHDSVARKYWFKANDGLRHSTVFTLHQEPQVMRPIPESRKVIQENCVRCHTATMSSVKFPHDAQRWCTDCHRSTPHGSVHSISSAPNAAVPRLAPVTPDWMTGLKKP